MATYKFCTSECAQRGPRFFTPPGIADAAPVGAPAAWERQLLKNKKKGRAASRRYAARGLCATSIH